MKLAAAIPIISTFASVVLATGSNVITISGSEKDNVVECGDTVHLEGTFYGQHDTDKFYYGIWASYDDGSMYPLGTDGNIFWSSDDATTKPSAPEKTNDGYKFTFSSDIKINTKMALKDGKHAAFAYLSPQDINGYTALRDMTQFMSASEKAQFVTSIGAYPITDKSKAVTLDISDSCTAAAYGMQT